jgi:CrcB protein
MSLLPCSAPEFQAWRWSGVLIGGAIGAVARFAIGNAVSAWRKKHAAAKDAAAAAQARGEAGTPPLADSSIAAPPPVETSWYAPLPFPLATFLCNIIGCLLIGILFGLFILGEEVAQARVHTSNPISSVTLLDISFGLCGPWKTFFVTGIVGAFTTMSSLALEFVTFRRATMTRQGVVYLLLSSVLGMSALGFGFACTRRFRDFSMHTNV